MGARMRTLNLTTAVIESMLANKTLLDNFNFLRYAQRQWFQPQMIGRPCCGKGAAVRVKKDQLAHLIKDSIMALDPLQRAKLKQLLNIDAIILFVGVGGQQRQRMV